MQIDSIEHWEQLGRRTNGQSNLQRSFHVIQIIARTVGNVCTSNWVTLLELCMKNVPNSNYGVISDIWKKRTGGSYLEANESLSPTSSHILSHSPSHHPHRISRSYWHKCQRLQCFKSNVELDLLILPLPDYQHRLTGQLVWKEINQIK